MNPPPHFEELLDIFETSGIAIPSDIRAVDALTPYAVESRYPGFWGEILESDVSEAITYAETALEWAEKFLQES